MFSRLVYLVILCPAIGLVTILLKATHEELIVMRINERNLFLRAFYEVLQTGRKKKEEKMCIQSRFGWGSESGSSRVAGMSVHYAASMVRCYCK